MKKKKYIWSVEKKTKRMCDQIGCNKVGEYIAPKKPNSKEKYFFVFIMLNYTIKDGIILQACLNLKFINFKAKMPYH